MVDCAKRDGQAALFRLEFGGSIGWGHVVRCGALAAELRQRGWRCDLWTGSEPACLPSAVRDPFAAVVPFCSGSSLPDGYRWTVVDDYSTSDEVLEAWRCRFPGKILVVDDEARRRLVAAHLVLNSRPGLDTSTYPPGVAALLGERYALLRAGLQRPVHPDWAPPAGTTPVLVMLGGTDPAGLTPVVLEALAATDAAGLVPVVIRPSGSGRADREEITMRRFPSFVQLSAVNDRELAGWAARCRMAVSAAGGTLFELAALRLPFVSVVVAGNQREFAGNIARLWGMPCVENGAELKPDLIAAVRSVLANLGRERAWPSVDFCGAQRVADAMGA